MLVEYIRNKKCGETKGEPVGCLVGSYNNGNIYLGYSKYNTKKESKQFSKYLAKKIAINRLHKNIENNIAYDSITMPYSITSDVHKFVNRCKKYYKL